MQDEDEEYYSNEDAYPFDENELAVGLIAATGRRPHEILSRAKFTAIEGESYHLNFEGQGKKRGDQPIFKIATLFPAEYLVKSLARLRREPSTKALLQEVAKEFPGDLAAQNRSIDNRRNGSLNRVVRAYFGDKGQSAPVLAFRYGEEQDNNKALRAAYGAIATKRDCDRSVGSQMLYFAQLLGHFVKENPTDKELQAIATTIGYADYFVTKPVSFPSAPQKEKLVTVRASEADFEALKNLQQELNLPNQQAVVNRLISSHQQKIDVAKELLKTKTQIDQKESLIKQLEEKNNQLQQEKKHMEAIATQLENQVKQLQSAKPTGGESQPQEIILDSKVEAFLDRIVEEKLQKALSQIPATQVQPQVQPTQIAPSSNEYR